MLRAIAAAPVGARQLAETRVFSRSYNLPSLQKISYQ